MNSRNKQQPDGFKWTHKATLLLIQQYKHHYSADSKVTFKNMWTPVSTELREKGIPVNEEQCKSKFTHLQTMYNHIKQNNSKADSVKQDWIYFSLMDDILQGTSSTVLVETSSTSQQQSNTKTQNSNISQPDLSEYTAVKRPKHSNEEILESLRNVNSKLIGIMQESQEKTEDFREQLLEIVNSVLSCEEE